MQIKELKISYLNINGLKSKESHKFDNHDLIESIQNSHIICLSETHTSQDDVIHVPGYRTHHISRKKHKRAPKASGGLVLLIKEDVKNGVKVEYVNSEMLWVLLDKSFFHLRKDIHIACVYFSPRSSSIHLQNQVDIMEVLENEIVKKSQSGKVMLIGDMNARTGDLPDVITGKNLNNIDTSIEDQFYEPLPTRRNSDLQTCSRGRQLAELCISTNLVIMNGRAFGDSFGKFTCHKYNGSSVVDYLCVDRELFYDIQYFEVCDFDMSISDHCMLSLSLETGVRDTAPPSKLESLGQQFKWGPESETKFVTVLQSPEFRNKIQGMHDQLVKCSLTINEMTERVNKIILQAASRTLLRKRDRKQSKKKHKRWFGKSCRELKKDLKQASRNMALNPHDKLARSTAYILNKQYKKLVKRSRRQYRNQILNKMADIREQDPQQYWKLLANLKQSDQNSPDPVSAISPQDWASFFSNLYKDDPNTPENRKLIETKVKELENEPWFNELNVSIKHSEITVAVQKLKKRKATGLDGISNEMLIASAPIFAPTLQVLFNKILTSGQYPSYWNKGYIKPLFKSGLTDDPSNYRGITICSSLGKLFSLILHARISNYIEQHNIIDETQIGFKKKSRTADHAFALKSLIDKYLKRNKHLYLCFIDLHKAFDSVWRVGLLYKVLNYGIRGNIYNVIKSMYQTSSCCININNRRTEQFPTEQGVMQGEILSPILFNLFMNDIPKYLDIHTQSRAELGGKQINCLMYADDIVIVSTTKEGLQDRMDSLFDFCQEWRLNININKTKVMCCNKTNRLNKPSFTFGGHLIENVTAYKYLGLVFSANGSFRKAENDLYHRALRASFKMRKLLHGTNVEPRVQLDLFNKIIKPVCLYGSEIWGPCLGGGRNALRKMDNNQLEKIQMSFGKYLLGVNKKSSHIAVRGELGLFPLYIDAIHSSLKYLNRLHELPADHLLRCAYQDNKTLNLEWYTTIAKCIRMGDGKLETLNQPHQIKHSIQNAYENEWLKQLNKKEGNKLDSYRTYKNTISREQYLSHVKNNGHRKAMSRLRISAHKLLIETGRYTNPKTPRQERICEGCNKGVEDEEHVTTECPLYDDIRQEVYKQIGAQVKHFGALNNTDKFIYMMVCEDKQIIMLFAEFIFNIFHIREGKT